MSQNNRLPEPTEYDAERLTIETELKAAGDAWAKAKANARYQEDAEKPMLADIIRKRNDEGAFELRKIFAYADADFRTYQKELHRAQFESDLAWLRLERARVAAEHFRSRWSLRKSMMENGL